VYGVTLQRLSPLEIYHLACLIYNATAVEFAESITMLLKVSLGGETGKGFRRCFSSHFE
jgi:hypothetical protein